MYEYCVLVRIYRMSVTKLISNGTKSMRNQREREKGSCFIFMKFVSLFVI